jgi:hypothetical protein
MKRYKVVGWYSHDPYNEHVRPFPRVVYVETDDPTMASDLGSDALDLLYEKEGLSVTFLNWYVVPA